MQHEQYARAWALGFVEGRRGVFVPLALIDVCEGNFYDAMLLAQIVYWCTPGASGETKLRRRYEGELWIAKRHHEWYDETRVREGTARACLKRLRAKGLIHYTLVGKGNDATPYLRVDWESLGRALAALAAREQDEEADAREDKSEMSHVRQDSVSEPKSEPLPDKFDTRLSCDDTRLSCDDTRLSCDDTPQTCPSYIAKNTSIDNPITTPPTTHHASRDSGDGGGVEGAASAKKGNKAKDASPKREAEKADTERAASKPYTTQDYQALLEAIPKLLEVSPALARRYATLLLGTAKAGEWGACKLETPMLAPELRDFVAYYRTRYPELSLPKTPRALHQHIHDFRREREAQARAAQARQARERRVIDMYSEDEARKVREMLEAGGLCTTNA